VLAHAPRQPLPRLIFNVRQPKRAESMKKKVVVVSIVAALAVLLSYRAVTSGWQDAWEHLIGGDNSLVVLVVDDAGMPIKDVVLQFSGTAYTPKYPFPFSPTDQKKKDFEIRTDRTGMAWVRWPRMTLGLRRIYVAGCEVKITNLSQSWDECWAGYAASFFAVCRYSKADGLTLIRPERNFRGDQPFKI
jgi:hypothetical protein